MHEVERMQLMQTLISWSKQSKGRSPEKKMLSFGFCPKYPPPPTNRYTKCKYCDFVSDELETIKTLRKHSQHHFANFTAINLMIRNFILGKIRT